MKPKSTRLVVSLFLLLISLTVFAQEKDLSIIKLKSGDEVKAKIISITITDVEYKSYYVQQGQSLKLSKSLISCIINPDGTKEVYDAPVIGSNSANSLYTNNPSSSLPVSDANSQELKKSIDNLNAKMEEITKGQQLQTKTLAEALITLNESVKSLKVTLEQGGAKTEQQNQDIVSKLNTVNNSIKDLKEETTQAKGKEEIKVRKFGFAVNILTNVNAAIFDYKDDPINKTIANTASSLSRVGNGFGLSIVINTGIEKKVGFRFEPELNFIRISTDANTNAGYFALSTNFFACIHKHRTNIYAGPALSFGTLVIDGSKFVFGTGIRFGGEYLIDSHFSIGLETGINYSSVIDNNDISSSVGMLSIPSKLVGRFYF
jgi:hypothetical protein